MSENVALQIHTIPAGAARVVQHDWTPYLRSGVTISSVTSVTIPSPATGVTFASAQVNAGVLDINGSSVAIGKAVTFTATAVTAGSYMVEVEVVLSTGLTDILYLQINVEGTPTPQ